MAPSRFTLLLVALCATIVTLHGLQNPESAVAKRTSKLQHLKEQFESFKKELYEVLAEEAAAAAAAETDSIEETGDAEKKCECDESSVEKRCPCSKKKPAKTPAKASVATDNDKRCPSGGCLDDDKRCAECDDSSPEKRCPSGCGAKKKAKQPVPVPAQLDDSEIMKRFLNSLPEEDRVLVQVSRSKKQFIERLIRKSQSAQNQGDINGDKAKAAEEQKRSVLDVGVRSMPAEDSMEMTAFKRNLDPKGQQLLKAYSSKTRFIQGLLERRTAADPRDVDPHPVPAEKRQYDEDPAVNNYINKLDESQKALLQQHPQMIEKLKVALQAGHREESSPAAKRQLSQDQVQQVLSKLSNPEDVKRAKAHLSKIDYLAEAEAKPQGAQDEEKQRREMSDDKVQEVLAKLGDPRDVELAKAHLSKIDHVAEAQSMPTGNQEEGVVSRIVSDFKEAKKRGYDVQRLISALKKRAMSPARK